MRTPHIELFTTTWCPDCRRTKRVLDELGASYRSVDIEQDPQAAELVIRHNGGRRRVPTVAIDGRYHGNPSPSELRALFAVAASASD